MKEKGFDLIEEDIFPRRITRNVSKE